MPTVVGLRIVVLVVAPIAEMMDHRVSANAVLDEHLGQLQVVVAGPQLVVLVVALIAKMMDLRVTVNAVAVDHHLAQLLVALLQQHDTGIAGVAVAVRV
jgi:hypothetical protein